ncbi:hypothetical protein HXX76_009900 [Chlamydomonas incerta]|uniref:Mitochondrial ribosomal protein L22 n=1 Tax=Chlamydomonas incerta TaxID=51695 RepID=A0A835SPR0_CHLIN|nr:hypothetical protein HXX76_009900 [Chlamydomonas incerta]|eukprot:KAG2430929.1 hypothetical protein HXX76_009900 [Chlamydomonas incerta]
MPGVEAHRLALLASRTLIARVQLGEAPAALSQTLSALNSVIHASTSHGSLECGCSATDAQPSTSSAAAPAATSSRAISNLAPLLSAQRPSTAFALSGLRVLHQGCVPFWQGARQLHAGRVAQHSADAPGAGAGGKEAEGSSKSQEQTVTNPLAAALASAAASGPESAGGGLAQASQAAAGRGRRQARNWMWYDEEDEREERRKERRRFAWAMGPGGEEVQGAAHLMDVPQSMKKMQRIIKLVRGLPYTDAVAQCTLVPHKAARYMLQALEAAYEDATQAKGLHPEHLVVGTVFVTRGRYEQGISFHAKGRPGANTHRRSHVRVVLHAAGVPPTPFARVVAPLMGRRSTGGGDGAPRPRFAYRTEL